MSLPRSFLEEIKSRVSVSAIVGRKVKLTRKGREFVGLSPFKNERTPSFTVNDDKQFYHCFASGKHGSIFDFLMEMEGLSFIEAVEKLAAEANLSMPERNPAMIAQEKQNLALGDVTHSAAAWFRQQLNSAAGREALAYLEKRHIPESLVQSFGIGYAPDSKNALSDFLLSKGFTQEQIIESGMAFIPEQKTITIDRFRNRLMFPIADARGRVIAFGGRALHKDVQAKYLNSPETPLFHKGRVLFNFDKARQPAHDKKSVLVCEGYMDVIGLARGGLHHAVASLGTAITENQIFLLWRMVAEPIMCLDGDEAGLKAAYRVVDRVLPLLKPGYSVRFAMLPSGLDPDDIIREGGQEAMLAILEKAVSLVDILWERECGFAPYDTPERRADLTSRLRKAVTQIQDSEVRKFYEVDIKARINKLFAPPKQSQRQSQRQVQRQGSQNTGFRKNYGNGYSRGGFATPFASTEARNSALVSGADMLPSREAMLVLAVLRHAEALHKELDAFENIKLKTKSLDVVRHALIDAINTQNMLDITHLKTHLSEIGHGDLIMRLEQLPGACLLAFVQEKSNPDDVRRGWFDALELQRKIIALAEELREVEKAAETQESFERLMAIKKEMVDLENYHVG